MIAIAKKSMRAKMICLGIAIMGLGCILIMAFNFLYNHDKPVSEFIVGRWAGNFQQVNEQAVEAVQYELRFIPPNIMLYSRISSDMRVDDILFLYKFISSNEIKIEGRITDTFLVTQDGEYLVIHSTHGFLPDGRYGRLPMIDKGMLAIFLIGILTCGILFLSTSSYHRSGQIENEVDEPTERQPGKRFPTPKALGTMIGFGIGILASREMWVWLPQHFSIGILCDSLIMIEISIAAFALGVRLVRVNHLGHPRFKLSSNELGFYFGSVLIGNGVWGTTIGLLRLLMILQFGSYVLQ